MLVTVQAPGPPAGSVEVTTSPDDPSTATHRDRETHEMVLKLLTMPLVGVTRAADQAAVALAGLVEANTFPNSSSATQNDLDVHEILEALLTCGRRLIGAGRDHKNAANADADGSAAAVSKIAAHTNISAARLGISMAAGQTPGRSKPKEKRETNNTTHPNHL